MTTSTDATTTGTMDATVGRTAVVEEDSKEGFRGEAEVVSCNGTPCL